MPDPVDTRALWITGPRRSEIMPVRYALAAEQYDIKTLYTGISRGTERLVFEGRVPEREHANMRAPLQEGEFSFPVKYGYSAVGRVLGSDAEEGRIVFALHPHQVRFPCPEAMAVPVPEGVPPARAILGANMETALNIVWDAHVQPGDRVAVVGAGTVGALVGYLAARIPGTEVCLVDLDSRRGALASALGCDFALPTAARAEADVVVHASASDAGLETALALAGLEAPIIEASWYGTARSTVSLGDVFHQRRLRLVSSQVGRIPADHAARWTHRRRLEMALRLLVDPALDALISGESHFDDLPRDYAEILSSAETLCHRVRYDD
ncbi:zinc-binding alcohol dehydrogenase [uncultured Roseovarius sp.]|uniref:zinc-dependent alcohol dehydrogenase n=1 Tax=uncultured Roseovarius sp. TaxID=293344 RepID=UPI002635FDCA|nr:zinc-binding alcohol dehydrogenase [uncultured Roseovarius sp.]